MNNDDFKFTINDDISTLEVIFSGELKGIESFETESFIRLQKRIRSDAESKLIYLNLEKVVFWDTEGMRQTLVFAKEINSRIESRVSIIAPRDSYIFKRASEKYPDIVDNIVPWRASRPRDSDPS